MTGSLARRPVTSATTASGPWLLSERADFWVASAGGGALLIVLALVLLGRGDRELSVADVLLGELHLGATYDAIVRRRLWRRMPLDVVAMPLAIVVATYVLLLNDGALLVTTAILYVGAWHRGRQSLGIARHYQRRAGGPVSSLHRWLLPTSCYLPMMAAVAYYTSTAATHEGQAFHGLSLDAEVLWGLASGAGASVVAYLVWTIGRTAAPGSGRQNSIGHAVVVHPGERWLVLANALGFGSAYVLGAWTSSFVLVLAIHHEVQYLYFTYALARRADVPGAERVAREVRRLSRFTLWPAVGLTSWVMCTVSGLGVLDPFLSAGLLGHYWLDGRIWTARARRPVRP
ncbi:MAG: hypothetical protein ACREK6_08135 [Candidatus Rokuibacteriota bacterium]